MNNTEQKDIKLTGKQKLFADYYVGEANLNATKAAIRAGYSPKTAKSIGSENLTKPDILAYIENRLDELTMPSKEILVGLTNEAKGSISDVLNENGEFDYAGMCERGADKLLKKLKIRKITRKERGSEDEIEEITHEFEMYDAQAAKVHLGKYHGLFIDKHEHTGAGGKPIEVHQVSLTDWKKNVEERRNQAAATNELFSDTE
jgi:phage terminase small subunit